MEKKDKKPTIIVNRSFQKTIQVKQFEPIKLMCSATQEVAEEDFVKTSEKLQRLCEQEVEKDAERLKKKNECDLCHAVNIETDKDGLCKDCQILMRKQAKNFRKGYPDDTEILDHI